MSASGLTTRLPSELDRPVRAVVGGARVAPVVDPAVTGKFLRTQRRRVARSRVSRPSFSKRAFDIIAVLSAMPVLLPVMGLIAVAIRLDSRGPAFFYQRRYGRGGQRFTLWKFRTMTRDAHEALYDHLSANTQHAWEWANTRKLRMDPRVTRVGRLLRRTSLDELPQVFNVLRGEMSLVGPRPLPLNERRIYGKAFALYCRATPGLTGLWQVSGRSDLPYSKRIELDTFYIRQRSAKLDRSILRRTLGAVWSKRGAY